MQEASYAFILKNFSSMYFDCRGKVKEVREYLENECGFHTANWDTKEYLGLEVLYVSSSDGLHEVHGEFREDGKSFPYNVYSIKNLLQGSNLCNKSVYRPIRLKE